MVFSDEATIKLNMLRRKDGAEVGRIAVNRTVTFETSVFSTLKIR